MRFKRATFLLALVCCTLVTAHVSAGSSSKSQLGLKEIEPIVGKYIEHSWFSGNILVSDSLGHSFIHSFGMANISEKIPNSRSTRFNIGSIAKNYTAVLVLQMIEQGKLSYETPLSKFNLGINDDIAKKVTVEHLLTHTAGFSDIFIPEYMNAPLSYDSLNKKIALLSDEPLLFEPGSDYQYSNYGYILLGAILEKITQKSYGNLLSDNIFKPTGAQSSSLFREEGNAHQSERYTYELDKTLKPTLFREVSGPDGGIESTVEDVYKFFNTLFFTDKLLQREGKVFKHYFGDGKHHGSYGGGTGVSAAVEVLRDQHVIIVVLANSDELVAERVSMRLNQTLQQLPVSNFKLPAKHFVYDTYKALGLETFKQDFPRIYKESGYSGFMGRPLNEAGLKLAKHGVAKEAIDIISTLSYFYPDAPQAYDSLAYVYYLLGNKVAAERAFESAKAISENFSSDYHPFDYKSAPLSR